jgi:hypothetical protein
LFESTCIRNQRARLHAALTIPAVKLYREVCVSVLVPGRTLNQRCQIRELFANFAFWKA